MSFSTDDMLGYRREAASATAGEPLAFDRRYRFAHLPLIAPDHPLVIVEDADCSYRGGVHPPTTSLVLDIEDQALRSSQTFLALDREIAASRFAAKIAWALLDRRWSRLHATIAGSLTAEEIRTLAGREGRAALGRLGPIAVELRGPFSGRVNRGRIYLRAYPEHRDGEPVLATVCRILGRPPADLFLVGLYHLTDELDGSEADDLRDIIAGWWDRTLLRFEVSRLSLLRARDDLVLHSDIVGRVQLSALTSMNA